MRDRGMTLIELLVSLMLAGSLAVTVLGLTGRQLATIQSNEEVNRPEPALALLTWDLQHTDQVTEKDGALVLETRCAIDPISHDIRFEAAEVEYRFENIAEQNWLLRTQKLDDQTQQQLVATGITRLKIGSIELTSGTQTNTPFTQRDNTESPESNDSNKAFTTQITIETSSGERITRGYLP